MCNCGMRSRTMPTNAAACKTIKLNRQMPLLTAANLSANFLMFLGKEGSSAVDESRVGVKGRGETSSTECRLKNDIFHLFFFQLASNIISFQMSFSSVFTENFGYHLHEIAQDSFSLPLITSLVSLVLSRPFYQQWRKQTA